MQIEKYLKHFDNVARIFINESKAKQNTSYRVYTLSVSVAFPRSWLISLFLFSSELLQLYKLYLPKENKQRPRRLGRDKETQCVMCPHTTHLNWYYLDQCIPATKSFSGQFNNNLSYLRLVCVLFTIENSRRCMTSELEQHLSRSDCIHTPLQCNDPNKKRTKTTQ